MSLVTIYRATARREAAGFGVKAPTRKAHNEKDI